MSINRVISYIFLGFLIISCGTQNEYLGHDIQEEMALKKVINDSLGQQVFKITHKKPRPRKGVSYAWYRNRSVRNTTNNYSGQLINGVYEQFDTDHILLKKGTYKNGLRRGRWQHWYTSGNIKKTVYYDSRGRLHKSHKVYSNTQQLKAHGNYRHGYKHGVWIEGSDTFFLRKKTVYRKKHNLKIKKLLKKKKLDLVFLKGYLQKKQMHIIVQKSDATISIYR